MSWGTFNAWGLHDHGAIDVIDQMTGEQFQWHGRWQHVRLDPGMRPFAIWRIAPAAGLPRDAVPDESDTHRAAHDTTFNEGAI